MYESGIYCATNLNMPIHRLVGAMPDLFDKTHRRNHSVRRLNFSKRIDQTGTLPWLGLATSAKQVDSSE